MSVPRVAVTVDLVVLTVREQRLCALRWWRDRPPYPDCWSLPGGFVKLDEDLPVAAARLMAERAGLAGVRVHLEQLATYGYPDRDPRQRVVSVAYLGLAPDLPASSRAQVLWSPVERMTGTDPPAFDHRRILLDGVERARAKLEYTALAAAFCAPQFTVAELRRVYEIVWGTALDPRNFHRKVTRAERFLVPTGQTTVRDGGRPARLYRRGDTELLHPPMLRPREPHQPREPQPREPHQPYDPRERHRRREQHPRHEQHQHEQHQSRDLRGRRDPHAVRDPHDLRDPRDACDRQSPRGPGGAREATRRPAGRSQ